MLTLNTLKHKPSSFRICSEDQGVSKENGRGLQSNNERQERGDCQGGGCLWLGFDVSQRVCF